MSIIQNLANTVTPVILGNIGTDNEKNLLNMLYTLIIARFADDNYYHQFSAIHISNENLSLFERFLPDVIQRDKLVDDLSSNFDISKERTISLISHAIPVVYNELRDLSGITSLPVYLRGHLSELTQIIPTWAYSLVPTSVLVMLNLTNTDK